MQFILPYIERLPGIPDSYNVLVAQILSALVFFLLLVFCAKVATWISNRVFPKLISKLHAEKWAEAFLEHKFFTAVGVVAAAVAAINWHSVFISENITWFANFMGKLTGLFVILSFSWLLNTFLNTINHLYGRNPSIPLKGLVQALKIVLFLGAGLFVLSLLLGRKPMYIITGLSALAAVFSLIFKDPILGFAASIQLTTNKLIKIGDWITVDSAGADGDIVDISLTCVRVQNFDKTIVSVPTYDLISKPFKNWSGMYEAKARRIQRSILLDVDTVRCLDKETFERLKKIDLLK
ncbi:MAG: mechanosensitive ion channel, partial [Elusimicrobiaceae bacterium]|nr:mechanosensitive ion channel [Elusimicrobiaceae bacterium]